MKNSTCISTILTLATMLTMQLSAHLPVTLNRTIVNKKTTTIRVLLESVAHNHSINLTSAGGFFIDTPQFHKQMPIRKTDITVQCLAEGYKIAIGSQSICCKTEQLRIESICGPIGLNTKEYEGTITLVCTDEKETDIVNTIDLERYVYAVLPNEIYQTWPSEMHKVQAIATRTYAAHCMQKNKKKHYDIGCSKLHQTYTGVHRHSHIDEAVYATQGIILSYQLKPIISMFDACCGGVVPAHIEQHDFDNAPYLARKNPCTFCKDSKLFSWQRHVAVDDFLNHLKQDEKIAQRIEKIGPLVRVNVEQTDRAGLVSKLLLRGTKKLLSIASKPLYNRLRSLFRSGSFSLKKKQDTIIASGKGHGHQVGLCQYGARELVRRGWDHRAILSFYYPGTKRSRIC